MGVAAFVCAFDVHWRQLRLCDVATHFARFVASHKDVRTMESGPLVALVGNSADDNGHYAAAEGALAIGNVRLDALPVPFVSRLHEAAANSDASVALSAWRTGGHAGLRSLIGDFALVMLDRPGRRLVACRDAFGVRLLVTRRVGSVRLFASHAWLLGNGNISREYVADLILGAHGTRTETVFSGVTRITPGTVMEITSTGSAQYTLWSSLDIERSEKGSESSDQFRDLLKDAITSRTSGEARFWTQLSGGVDSSSVTSLAAMLTKGGGSGELAGALTVVDTLGTGDESIYSDAVVEKFAINNRKLTDYWPWRDDGEGPPGLCDAHPFFAFYELRRATCKIVRRSGARVILTGIGSDHYLSGNYDFVSDLLWQRRFTEATRILSLRAIDRKKSFWGMLWDHAVLPLMPFGWQARLVPKESELPAWFPRDFVRKYGLRDRVLVPRQRHVPRGQLFRYQVDRALRSLDHGFTRGPFESEIEARHPFLYRPLVEHALSLPQGDRVGPLTDKVVLRKAMRGILPDCVRTRSSKGDIDARIAWALHHENRKLRHLVEHSMLADLGCVEPRALGEALERGRRGMGGSEIAALFSTLSLELWLNAHFDGTRLQGCTHQTSAPQISAGVATQCLP